MRHIIAKQFIALFLTKTSPFLLDIPTIFTLLCFSIDKSEEIRSTNEPPYRDVYWWHCAGRRRVDSRVGFRGCPAGLHHQAPVAAGRAGSGLRSVAGSRRAPAPPTRRPWPHTPPRPGQHRTCRLARSLSMRMNFGVRRRCVRRRDWSSQCADEKTQCGGSDVTRLDWWRHWVSRPRRRGAGSEEAVARNTLKSTLRHGWTTMMHRFEAYAAIETTGVNLLLKVWEKKTLFRSRIRN